MSHQVLAAVWDQLGRRDVSNVLREIIGQHASELALLQLEEDRIASISPLMRAVTWIKAIFDLQRTYLQGTQDQDGWDPYLTPYLLPSNLIYSTLLYLVNVKTRLFPHPSTAIREFSKHRFYIAQTLLSGVRVILLRQDRLSAEKKYNFERALGAAWQHGRLTEVEAYLVYELLPEALDQIPSSDSADEHVLIPEAISAHIPSFMSGLYPLRMVPEQFVPEALVDIKLNGRGRVSSFWGLFDALWATEAAVTQCHLERRRQAMNPAFTAALSQRLDEELAQAEDVRRALILAISNIPVDSATANTMSMLTILTMTLIEPMEEIKATDYGRTTERESLTQLLIFLTNRSTQLWDCNRELERANIDLQRSLKEWLHRAAPESDHRHHDLNEQGMPIYIVDCPALHPVTKSLLEETLRGSREWGNQAVLIHSPFLSFDISCPLCPGNARIQHARLVEPLEQITNILSEKSADQDDTSSRFSVRLPSVSDTLSTSRSGTLSHSTSRSSSQPEATEQLIPPLFGVLNSPMTSISEQPPTPSGEAFLSPVADSTPAFSPSETGSTRDVSRPLTRETSATSSRQDPKPVAKEMKPAPHDVKPLKPTITRKAISFRSKSSKENSLPPKPLFSFSTAGSSLLFWGDRNNFVVRFDVSDVRSGIFRSCRYDTVGVELAAGGDRKTCVIASDSDGIRRLIVFSGNDSTPQTYTTIDAARRGYPRSCMAVSRDDKYVALSVNDQIQIYRLDLSVIRRVILPGQMQSYQLAPHLARNLSVDPNALQSPSKKALTWKEAEQEAQRQSALIERKLWFSEDSQKLVIATHLGDHHVYLDVWDCSTDPFKITSDYSRSFKLPPWTTNDGDLTCIFFDTLHRSAFLTAFLNKEYPNLIPIPGYDEPVYETYATKVVHAAQSPGGSRFVVANGMTEFYIFDYKPNGRLSPRRLKKAASKMSSSTFKPGHIVLGMPEESTLLVFWVKDPKLVLRCIRVGDVETFQDFDVRSEYEKLMRDRPTPAELSKFEFRRPSLPAGNTILELSSRQSQAIAEMPAYRSIAELPATRGSYYELPSKR